MKTVLLFLTLTASVGCGPTAQALCEAKADCGLVDDVDTCFDGLHAARTAAEDRGCEDHFYAFVDCQVELELACTDALAAELDESCSFERCEYAGCVEVGASAWKGIREWRCSGEGLDPTGTWALFMRTETNACTDITYREIVVTKSGGQFQLMLSTGIPVTGTVQAADDSAYMEATFQDGNVAISLRVTAERIVAPSGTVAALSGSGNRSVNGCSDQVILQGDLRSASP